MNVNIPINEIYTMLNQLTRINRKAYKWKVNPIRYRLLERTSESIIKNNQQFSREVIPAIFEFKPIKVKQNSEIIGMIDYRKNKRFISFTNENINKIYDEIDCKLCHYCNNKRKRNTQFVISNGVVKKIIGSCCIKSFTDVIPQQFFNFKRYLEDFKIENDNQLEASFDIKKVLNKTIEIVNKHGYVKYDKNNQTTSYKVKEYIECGQ